MDSYNHMMDPEYGNMMYNTMSNQMGSEGIIMQNPETSKDIQYAAQRESIIATTNTSEAINTYQHSQPANVSEEIPIGNGEMKAEYLTNEPIDEYDNPSADDAVETDVSRSECIAESTSAINDKVTTTDVNNGIENNANVQRENKIVNPDENITVTKQELVDHNEEENDSDKDETETETEKVNGNGKDNVLDKLELEPVPDVTDKTVAIVSGTKSSEEIDENQCRICLSNVDLINIFSYEKKHRICDIIMAICTSVKIMENDYLPHYICTKCLTNLRTAHDFKITCEATDKELRKKLKRGKTKLRRPGRYLIIDCELTSSDEEKKAKAKDDDEFQISDAPDISDSDASYTIGAKRKKPGPKRKRNTRNRRSTGDIKSPPTTHKKESRGSTSAIRSTRHSTRNKSPEPEVIPIQHVFVDAPRIIPMPISGDDSDESGQEDKMTKSTPATPVVQAKRRGRPPAMRDSTGKKIPTISMANKTTSKVPHKKRQVEEISSSDDDEDADSYKPTPKKRGPRETKERPCNVCEKVFTSWQLLKEHKKTHKGEKPLTCNICSKPFKQRVSLEAHIQKHKEDDTRMCKPCNKLFASRLELRKHQQTVHEEEFTFECEKCKRTFTTKSRLDKHKEGKCPGFDTTVKKKTETEVAPTLGRDLFKCVAPLTSTYWSDSFSD